MARYKAPPRFLPTPIEIQERAREVREQGFENDTGFHRPWSDRVERIRRDCPLEPRVPLIYFECDLGLEPRLGGRALTPRARLG